MLTSHASRPASWKADSISLSPLLPSCRSTHTLGRFGDEKTTTRKIRKKKKVSTNGRHQSSATARAAATVLAKPYAARSRDKHQTTLSALRATRSTRGNKV